MLTNVNAVLGAASGEASSSWRQRGESWLPRQPLRASARRKLAAPTTLLASARRKLSAPTTPPGVSAAKVGCPNDTLAFPDATGCFAANFLLWCAPPGWGCTCAARFGMGLFVRHRRTRAAAVGSPVARGFGRGDCPALVDGQNACGPRANGVPKRGAHRMRFSDLVGSPAARHSDSSDRGDSWGMARGGSGRARRVRSGAVLLAGSALYRAGTTQQSDARRRDLDRRDIGAAVLPGEKGYAAVTTRPFVARMAPEVASAARKTAPVNIC